MIPGEVWVALSEAGVAVRQLGPNHSRAFGSGARADIELTDTSSGKPYTWIVEVKSWDRTLTPSMIYKVAQRMAGRPVLAVVPRVSHDTLKAAVEQGWSILATNPGTTQGPTGWLTRPDRSLLNLNGAASAEQPTRPRRRRGRLGYGASLVSRRLLTGRAGTQADLAERCGLSQARISQTLSDLRGADLVWSRHGPANMTAAQLWEPTDWDNLLDHLLAIYPGPGGTTTYWYGLNPPAETAVDVLAELNKIAPTVSQAGATEDSSMSEYDDHALPIGARARPSLSGETAADEIAQWARPQRAVVYSRWGADLRTVGLTPAPPADATVELVVPADPGAWLVPTDWPDLAHLSVVDPFQILWDLGQSHSTDADQAAAQLRGRLRNLVKSRGPTRTEA